MFTIRMYQFNKKINSTKKPDNVSGTDFECEMKDSSSILFPVVEIRTANNNMAIPLYNYAYIEDFGRYYWIDDIDYNMGFWTISMHCDALASFQTDILNSWQYVVRSASNFDDTIADTLYMTKSYPYDTEYVSSNYAGINGDSDKVYLLSGNTMSAVKFFNVGITSGTFVVGIVGNNTTGVTYYSMSNASFKTFINNALTFTPSDMTDVSSGVANAVFNPIQYITSVKWFPVAPYYASTTSAIKVGGYTIPGGYTAGIVDTMNVSHVYMKIDIPKHYSGRKYTNLSPYTELNLVFQPFGVIPIDTTKVYNSDSLSIEVAIDFCGGLANLYIYRQSNAVTPPYVSALIYSVAMDYGVTLPISSLVMDWKAGAVVSAMQFVKTMFTPDQTTVTSKYSAPSVRSPRKSAGSGSPPPITTRSLPERTDSSTNFVDLLDKAMDLTASALGQISTTGAIGSFLAYTNNTPYLYAWFKQTVMIDIKRFGAPLYQQRQLKELSGFCVCMNATFQSVSGSAMQEETVTIQTLLNTGVYLEK